MYVYIYCIDIYIYIYVCDIYIYGSLHIFETSCLVVVMDTPCTLATVAPCSYHQKSPGNITKLRQPDHWEHAKASHAQC